MEYGLAKHSRNEKSTKNNIPTTVEPLIDTVEAIFPTGETEEWRVQTNVVLAKKNKRMSLLESYDEPAWVPISLASLLNNGVHVKTYFEVMFYLLLYATHSSLLCESVFSVSVIKAKYPCMATSTKLIIMYNYS